MISKFEDAFNNAHEFKFDKFQFDEPDYQMLIIQDEDDYLEHLRVQGAGLAYYTALAKQAERNYDEFERKFKFRYNEMYSDCSNRLLKEGKKNNVRDIESYVQVKYEGELNKMYERLDELKAQRDYICAFLEGWKQKSYQLSSMTNMITAGLLTPKENITEEDIENNRKLAREILNKRKTRKEKETE